MLVERVTQWLLAAAGLWPNREVKTGESKRIAIVGGGSAGLGALAAILSLPEEVRLGRAYEIELFEERRGLGGIWLPDEHPPHPSTGQLPETPLYPRLRTNTPHPTMTFPHFPFPPLTPLYPSHEHVERYHSAFASHLSLHPFIHLNHSVVNASYSSSAKWTLAIRNDTALVNRTFDHLVVASGHNHFPYIPQWDGLDEWLNGGEGREIVHSIYYRKPERYAGRTVVVVGYSASGGDMAAQVAPFARKTYHSYTNTTDPLGRVRTRLPGTHSKPRISHFDSKGIIFTDGSRLSNLFNTTLLLGTGYELTVPFLAPLTPVRQFSPSHSLRLSTNLRYIRPLHRVVFAIDQHLPLDALAFVGLPVWIANAPSDFAQGLFVAHALADRAVLPRSKEAALKQLEEEEDQARGEGNDPFWIGHRFATDGSAQDYQDALITRIRETSSLPLPAFLSNASEPYVEPWRRQGRGDALLMRRGWLRAEALGVDQRFLEGAKNEEEWVEVMTRVARWQRDWEEGEGRQNDAQSDW